MGKQLEVNFKVSGPFCLNSVYPHYILVLTPFQRLFELFFCYQLRCFPQLSALLRKLFIPCLDRIIHFAVCTKVKAEEIGGKMWTDQRGFSSKTWQNMPWIACGKIREEENQGWFLFLLEQLVASGITYLRGKDCQNSSPVSSYLHQSPDNPIHIKFSHVKFCPTPLPSSVSFLQDRNMYHPLYSQITQVFLRWNQCFLSTVNK